MKTIINNYNLIRCPYCQNKFKLLANSVICKCDEFPIVKGILYLDKENAKLIMDKLNKGDEEGAVGVALGWGKRKMFLNLLLWLAKRNIYLYWLWGFSRGEWNYYINRDRERESDLFWIPTKVTGINICNWVDIGSGFGNKLTGLVKIYPGLHVISIDKSFRNLLIGRMMNGWVNVVSICTDISVLGNIFVPKTIDVATLIDVLPFIKNQGKILSQLSKEAMSPKGVLVVSSMVEHVYLENVNICFPMRHEVLLPFLPSKPIIFDESKVLRGSKIKNALLSENMRPEFRYGIIWPNKNVENLDLKKGVVWERGEIKWRNRVY